MAVVDEGRDGVHDVADEGAGRAEGFRGRATDDDRPETEGRAQADPGDVNPSGHDRDVPLSDAVIEDTSGKWTARDLTVRSRPESDIEDVPRQPVSEDDFESDEEF